MDAVLFGQVRERVNDVITYLTDVCRLYVENLMPGFHSSEVDYFLYQCVQPFSVPFYQVDVSGNVCVCVYV